MPRMAWMHTIVGAIVLMSFLVDTPAFADDSVRPRTSDTRLTFEVNQGQFDDRVRFASRGPGYTLFLTDTEAVMVMSGTSVIRLALDQARPRQPIGIDQQPGIVNYLRGRDPSKWRTGIATYARVTQREVLPGVDLVYYGNGDAHEYDLVVAPGTSPSAVAMRVSGADRVSLDATGNLQMATAAGNMTMKAPHVYQTISGTRMPVEARFALSDAGAIAFDVGAYDTTLPLVIDPELVYGTFLGGSGQGFDTAAGVAVDEAGAAYIVGTTEAADFPTQSPLQPNLNGLQDAVVTKLSAAGQRIYATYLGGSGYDGGVAIAVRADGVAYVLGGTTSNDLPVPGAFQAQHQGSGDAFVVELNREGTGIVRGTYLGGTAGETPRGLELSQVRDEPPASQSAFGDVLFVYGSTTSVNFPAIQAPQANRVGDQDGFVTVFNRQTLQPTFSSYAGIPGTNYADALTLNRRSGAMYLLLRRTDDLLPQIGHFTPVASDASLSEPAATAEDWNLVVNALFIGNVQDTIRRLQAKGLAIGSCPRIQALASTAAVHLYYRMLCGNATSSPDLISSLDVTAAQLAQTVMIAVMPGCFPTPPSNTCSERAELLFFDANMQAIAHVNFGGQRVGREFIATRAVIGIDGRIHFIGKTNDATLPLVNPVQTQHRGGSEGFVLAIDPVSKVTSFFTYLGGSSHDNLNDITLDKDGNRWIVGDTQSANFPVTPNGVQPTLNGRTDGFVVKISADPPGPAVPGGLTAATNGFNVALAWNAAPGATSYQLEVGSQSGLSNLLNANVGNLTTLQSPGPQGTYFARVRAHTPAGLSAPSNEVSFVLGPPGACGAAPPAPTGYAAQVANLNVSLSWNASPRATSYVLEAGSGPGLANLFNANVGAATALAAAAPPGTYHTRVRAVNACGTSGPSNEVTLTLGCSAPPVSASGMTFSKSGAILTVGWTPSPNADSYRLQAGTAPGLSNVLDANIGSVTGLQANISGVPAGTYFVRVVAINGCGGSGPSTEVAIPVP